MKITKDDKEWFKREIKPAYKQLKKALKSKDKALYLNALQWLHACIEPAKENIKAETRLQGYENDSQ